MKRSPVAWLVAVSLTALSATACFGGMEKPQAEIPFPGDVPLVLINQTDATIRDFMITEGREVYGNRRAHIVSSGKVTSNYKKYGTPIPPGARHEVRLAPGTYALLVEGQPPKSVTRNYNDETLLSNYVVELQGPTEIVVYKTDKPSEQPTPGFKRLVEVTFSTKVREKMAAEKAAAQQERGANYRACTAELPPKNEKPAPGRTRADGKWTCIVGGDVTGTNFVNLAQLADGKITATVTGMDRNISWEGAVVGDEVHFRYAGMENVGGKVKLDPGGRAMTGNGYTFTDDGRCLRRTLTCTKQ